MGSGNWIVDNLNSALATWNEKLTEIWTLISTSPEEFKGGGIWDVILNIHDALRAIGYALLVLFFVAGVVKTCGSFTELKRPEVAVKTFVRFALAQGGRHLRLGADDDPVQHRPGRGVHHYGRLRPHGHVRHGPARRDGDHHRGRGLSGEYPAVGGNAPGIPVYLGFVAGHDFDRLFPLFQTLYGDGHRAHPPGQFRGGSPSSSIGVAFIKSYAAICLEGCMIVLACIIFSQFAAAPPAIADDTMAAATIVWNYIGELVFNMLVLVGAIKMSDRLVRELMGLG